MAPADPPGATVQTVGTRRAVAALVAAVVVVVVVGAVSLTLVIRHHRDRVYGCAGVGLQGPTAASPDAALAAYVASAGGRGSDWSGEKSGSQGRSESYVFTPTRDGVKPTLKSISVSGRDGAWHADGACV